MGFNRVEHLAAAAGKCVKGDRWPSICTVKVGGANERVPNGRLRIGLLNKRKFLPKVGHSNAKSKSLRRAKKCAPPYPNHNRAGVHVTALSMHEALCLGARAGSASLFQSGKW